MPTDIALVRSPIYLNHRISEAHPENPQRLSSILSLFHPGSVFAELPVVAPTEASREVLETIHDETMVSRALALKGQTGWWDADTYYGERSIETALLAAGACVALGLKIWRGEYRRGFALVRPPGHHATPAQAMGFCFFNNVALAVAAIQAVKPTARVAVVDFDLHHGNGTQDAFYDNPNVCFISSHRFPYYPGTGALDDVGAGKGRGTTVNFPLDRRYGDELFVSLYADMVAPILKAFRPEMIIVSAGFDGHIADPMKGFEVHTETYGLLSQILIQAAEETTGKILFCLEGGYDPAATSDSVATVIEAMIETPRQKVTLDLPSAGGEELAPLERFRAFHRQFFPELG